MKDDSIELSKKNLALRIVVFALALAVAVGAFTFGVKRLAGNETGVALVSARADGDAPLYASAVRLTYRFDGGSRAIRELKNEITDAYSSALLHVWKLLDPETLYTGYDGNLAYLNRHLNEDVTVPQELFDILVDALAYSDRGEAYNLYAAPLFAEWESICYTTDAAEFDPAGNASEAERLRAIAQACADRENCALEIVDAERRVVRLNVAQSYLDFLSEMELPRTVMDLNTLKEAFLLRAVAAVLEARGYSDGCLTSKSGLTLSLSGDAEGAYAVNSYVNHTAVVAASVPTAPGTACSAFSAFPPEEGTEGFYTAEGNLRCAVRPALDGEGAAIDGAFVLRRDGDLLAAACESLALASQTELREARALAGKTSADLAVLLPAQSDGRTLLAAGAAVGELTAQEGFQTLPASE